MSDDTALRRFGITALRPHQQAAHDALRRGRDVLVVLSTGGGKSLCYQFPAAAGLAPAIVVSPLVALMRDQVEALRRKGIAAARLSSDVAPSSREETWRLLEDGSLALLYLAPEALDSPGTRARLARAHPCLLAIDEAHCISEWGESFRPAYLRLRAARAVLGDPPTIALTATATLRTRRDIIERLALRDPEYIESGFDRPNLHLAVAPVRDESERTSRLTTLALRAPGPAVYYASTRRRTESLAAQLRRAGVAARAYHAALPAADRARVQDDFLVNRLRVIVATCAFGMGVDKPDVRLVVHATVPSTLEAYYQEAGRAGRDGEPGRCVLLRAPGDVSAQRLRLRRELPSMATVRRVMTLVRDAERQAHPAPADAESISRALAIPVHQAAESLALLVEGHLVRVVGSARGSLRVLVRPDRLACDTSVAPDDRAFVDRVVTRFGPDDGGGRMIPRAQLAALEDGVSLDERIRRVTQASLLVWTPEPSTLRVLTRWSDAVVELLLEQRRRRARYDLWRFDGVARFVETTRCRRLVLLRYFSDAPLPDACGRCDICCRDGGPPSWGDS